MKGLILAGGHGTRLRPLTFTGNKHMIPIANKPMLLYGLEHLSRAGIEEIGIILGPIREGVREIVGDGSKYGIKITYIDQPDPKGLAHAVIVELDSKGKLCRLVEKPKEPKSNLALAGAYLFNNSIFEAAKKIQPSWRNELEITDAIQFLLENGHRIRVQYVDGWWKDTGKPDDLLEA